ncbi:MAG: membrane protein insertion efficiency factor YidD [Spirochaetes bacterium]|nr:membrane protein insertion efficiency factor YidD [Spirochaetota bacterium]MBX3723277.1 membrane protein insertion efficiency factor YidD [Turneriella sp.]
MKRIFIFFIRFYQYTFAAILGGQCRFHPTCSEYAVECFEKLPAHRAFVLTLWRILRCQPFAKSGYDPVPPAHKPHP